MDKQVFSKGMAILGATFDKKLDSILLGAYWEALKDDFTNDEFEEAVKHLMRSSSFFPKPKDFLTLKEQDEDSLYLEAKNAFNEFIEAYSRYGSYKSYEFANPLIANVVNSIGGLLAFNVDMQQLRFIEKDFIRLYMLKKKKFDYSGDNIVQGLGDEIVQIGDKEQYKDLYIALKRTETALERTKSKNMSKLSGLVEKTLKKA